MNRINYVNLLLGKRGTGKTFYIINNLLPVYTKLHPQKKVFIFDTLDHPNYKQFKKIDFSEIPHIKKTGAFHCFSSDTDSILKQAENIYNSLLIFEDSSKYLRRQIPDSVRRFILDSKQKNTDILFLFHGFSFVPPELFRIADGILLFKCDNPAYRKADIINYNEVESAYNQIMKSKNPYIKKYVQIY